MEIIRSHTLEQPQEELGLTLAPLAGYSLYSCRLAVSDTAITDG